MLKMSENWRALLQKLTPPLDSCHREVQNQYKSFPILILDQHHPLHELYSPCLQKRAC